MNENQPWSELPKPLIPLEDTFEGFLDLHWIECTDARAEVTFAVRDNLKQPLGLLHGGIYCAVAETVASVATARAVWNQGMAASGLSNNASFLRPITAGDVAVGARRRSHNADEWVWMLEFSDERAQICALVTVTIAVRPRLTSGGA